LYNVDRHIVAAKAGEANQSNLPAQIYLDKTTRCWNINNLEKFSL